jgi:phage terminase Nu1 subunit (DNA packaging protein)
MPKKKRNVRKSNKKKKKSVRKSNKKFIPDGCVDTLGKVAKKFGVTIKAVEKWKAQGMPTRSDGFYDIEIIKNWKQDRIDKITGARSAWDQDYRKWKAKSEELDYRKKIGELISRKEVEEGRVARIHIVKRAFLALPREVAARLSGLEPREIEVVLRERIKNIIRKFSE